MRAIGASAANLREALEQKLRHIPILGGVSAVGAALGVVALLVGVIGVHAVYNTNKEVRALEAGANRAIFAERANSLVYAVVMDSRGIYMSSKATDRANYGAGVMKFLAELDVNMAAWKEHVAPEDREDFVRAQARAQEFIQFRTELVRLGNEVGQVAALHPRSPLQFNGRTKNLPVRHGQCPPLSLVPKHRQALCDSQNDRVWNGRGRGRAAADGRIEPRSRRSRDTLHMFHPIQDDCRASVSRTTSPCGVASASSRAPPWDSEIERAIERPSPKLSLSLSPRDASPR